MALGQIGKPNNALLDTLLQLNDLVASLRGKDLIDAIAELKEKTETYNKAKSETEPLIHALNDATKDNEKSLVDLKVERNLLSADKITHERQLQKIKAAQSAVDHDRAEVEKRVADAEAEIAKKSQAVAAREVKAEAAKKQADAVVAEYQAKLADLKKITG